MKAILLAIAIPVLVAGMLTQAYAQKADIVNSKYLTITDQTRNTLKETLAIQ